ncbi:MAG: ABC transporter permease [Anaerolineales bacterium]
MSRTSEIVASPSGGSRPEGSSLGGHSLTRILPHQGVEGVPLREIWDSRDLLGYLIWRDLRVRYKQTLLGAGWAILQPFISMIVFTVFFGGLLKVPSEGLPYAVFSFAALVPWGYFSSALGGVSGSLVGNAGLLTKVYFPRLLIPLGNMIARLADFGVALLIVFALIAYYRLPLRLELLSLPLFLLLMMVCTLGVGLWLAAINVYYRDVQVIVPFLLQLWLFATPIVYPSSLVGSRWRVVYALNPMVAIIEGFRWALLGTSPPDLSLWVSLAMSLVFLASGILVFQRTQRTMADVV